MIFLLNLDLTYLDPTYLVVFSLYLAITRKKLYFVILIKMDEDKGHHALLESYFEIQGHSLLGCLFG